MSAEPIAVLKSKAGAAVPLQGVSARGQLTGLLFELTVEQVYENESTQNIEAVFTFPVPHRAVLLGLELEIGDRALQAVAVRRQAARANYERAMDEGDSAALLEQAGDGLYSLSLGNVMAGERALIRYRYAELLHWHGEELRLLVPTVIAPRYGDATAHGVEPHQVPGVDLLAEYPFELSIDVIGDLAGAILRSPSHAVRVEAIEGGRRISLDKGAFLDRDFVLCVAGVRDHSASLVAPDGDGYVALLSIDPRLAEPAAAPLGLKLVVDCSGSMGGTSIGCARRAMLAILDRLGPADQVSVTRFGSTVEQLAPASGAGSMRPASASTIEWLRHRVRDMDADLGGTELAGALRAATAIRGAESANRNILLITDAEVWAVEQVLAEVAQSGHRLFVVAVGAAPAEALARQMGEKTGGACEFVGPNEDVEGAIVRMFRRMREAPKRIARVDWLAQPLWQAPLPAAVFSGDTLHILAGFAHPPAGETRVVIDGLDEGAVTLTAKLPEASAHGDLPRVAAARRLSSLPEDEAARLAEQHQLVSEYTSFIVVQLRDAEGKATALPELRAVPQMLAAGWGASADVALFRSMVFKPSGARPVPGMADEPPTAILNFELSDELSEPIFQSPVGDVVGSTPAQFLQSLAFSVSASALPATLIELHHCGVPRQVLEELGEIIRDSAAGLVDAERDIIGLYIGLLARSPAGDGLDPASREALCGPQLGDRQLRTVRARVAAIVASVSASCWSTEQQSAGVSF
ncbi:MAG: VIT and VWA domain-containing protein [Gammaproteobacteria bacterium]|nr:VIT and VWA domain-containing protein [Gammaproteobacteria bacterium]